MKRKVIPFVHPRRSREEIREQVCVWLARLDGGATAEEMEQLESWLAEDPRHLRMLLSMAAMWDRSLILSELAEVFPLRDKNLSLEAPRRRALLAAAALGVVAVSGSAFFGLRSLELRESAARFDEVYETVVGARESVDLPDGSEIILNTDTRIEVAFTNRARDIVLERGEVYFNVAHDEAKPFRVYVGSRVVEAVGTAFSIQQTAQKDLEIIVTEGKVNFIEMAATSDPASSAENGKTAESQGGREEALPLAAGERATIAGNGVKIEKTTLPPEELEVRLAWRVGMLVFEGEALEIVLKEVSRYSTIKLEAEESIRDIPVDGFFRAGDIDGLLVSMQRHFEIDYQRISDDQILLTAGKQED